MKKISLLSLFFAFLFISPIVKAQNEENNLKNFRFGLHASPSIAWYKPDNLKIFTSEGSKLKFAYGLLTEFRLNKVASFSTGINVCYSGGMLNYVQDSSYYTVEKDTFFIKSRTFNMIYADIPITLKMKTPEIGAMTYFGQFGVNLGVKTKARANDKGTFLKTSANVAQDNIDISKDMNLFRLGLNIGLGAEYNIAETTSLLFSVNYHNGLTNIAKKESDLIMDYRSEGKKTKLKTDIQSNYFSLSVGVLF